MLKNKIIARTADLMLKFVRRDRQIEIILLAHNMKKYSLDEVHLRLTPSNSALNLPSNLLDDNYFLLLKQTIHKIVVGNTVELTNMQYPESVTPIISPFVVN